MAPQEDRRLLVGGSSSYGALTLPASSEGNSKRSAASKLVGFALLGLGVVAVVMAVASNVRVTSVEVKSALDATYDPTGNTDNNMPAGTPAFTGQAWASMSAGPVRPMDVYSTAQSVAHEVPRQDGLWMTTTRGDYTKAGTSWDVFHEAPTPGYKDGGAGEGDGAESTVHSDNTWRFGYKWAVTQNYVSDDGWGPCYPACGPSVQFRTVVCIRSDETVVEDARCERGRKPHIAQKCKNFSKCHPCWEVTEWGACGHSAREGGAGVSAEPGDEPVASVCNEKGRQVRCRFCEPEAELSPSNAVSPLLSIGWVWGGSAPTDVNYLENPNPDIDMAGVSGSHIYTSETTMNNLWGFTDSQVCAYGKVGICDAPVKEDCDHEAAAAEGGNCEDWDSVADERMHEAYFCGFDVAPEDCTREESQRREFLNEYASHDQNDDASEFSQTGRFTVMDGYNCNVIAAAMSPESIAFIDNQEEYANQHLDLECREGTPNFPACNDWISNGARFYSNRQYHLLGPFDTETLEPSAVDSCVNYEKSGGNYKWWYADWEADHALVCFNETWFNPDENRWIPRLKTDTTCVMQVIEGWDGKVDNNHASLTEDRVFRSQAPQELFAEIMNFPEDSKECEYDWRTRERGTTPNTECSWNHEEQFCGGGHHIKAHRCCRAMQVGSCEQSGERCYCDGAHTIFLQEAATFGGKQGTGMECALCDDYSEGNIHPETFCPLMIDDLNGVTSPMFSYIANDGGYAKGSMREQETSEDVAWTIPVTRRQKCGNYQEKWECEAYPNVNQQWPPADYKLSTTIKSNFEDADWDNMDADIRLLEQWIVDYQAYDPTAPDFGIEGYTTGTNGDGGCDMKLLPSSCVPCEAWMCQGVWQCNCWRDCDEDVKTAVVNKTDAGYQMPRDPSTMSYPPDGEVNIGSAVVGDVWVPVLEREECEECPAACGLTSHQCRQCWCEYIPEEFGFWLRPDSPSVLGGDYAHMAQYKESVIDPTGDSCFQPWAGHGTPPPNQVRACSKPQQECKPNWCISEHFDDCGAACGQNKVDRPMGCCDIQGRPRPIQECEPNPLGDSWELIMTIGEDATEQPFWFGSEYWEDSDMMLNDQCADAANRKMHAFNALKFNIIKMCFGYGFEVENADFEMQSMTAMEAIFDQTALREGQQITGWTLQGDAYVLLKSSASNTAASGVYLAGLYGSASMSTQIGGLSPGLLTTVRVMLGSKAGTTASAALSLGSSEYLVIRDVPSGGLKEYTFHFTPAATSVTFKVTNTATCNGDYCLLVDALTVQSAGFEIVAQEIGGSMAGLRDLSVMTTASAYADQAMGGSNFNIGPTRGFGKDWDEVLMLWGDNHELNDADSDGSTDTYYQFRPTGDIFELADVGEDMTINDVKSNDAVLIADIQTDGGAKMCRQPDGQESFWSLNSLDDGATKDPEGGCARAACTEEDANGNCVGTYDYEGHGVYYAGSGLLGGFVGNRPEGVAKGYTASEWNEEQGNAGTLQIFVRKTNAHGSEDERQSNCIQYKFNNAMWMNATTLFSAGEMFAGDSDKLQDPFHQMEFSRVFTHPQDNANGVNDMGKPGFNVGLSNYDCDQADWGHNQANNGYNAVFVRWGYMMNVPSQDFNADRSPTADMDDFVGIGGLSTRGGSCHECEANGDCSDDSACGIMKIGAGWGTEFNNDDTEHTQKAWLWVADTTVNPGIDGFKYLVGGDWNMPGFKVLDGSANKFDTINGCMAKCAEMDNCLVGVYVNGEERFGECWLASKQSNESNTEFCGADSKKQCTPFLKAPALSMRTCNAYVYEEHMVLPGGGNWDLNKFFATGVVFEVKEGLDQYSETVFGPVTTREVISKQFSYGKQTYVYWAEDQVNLDTLRSKCVFTQGRSVDTPTFVQWPGRIVQCEAQVEGEDGMSANKVYRSIHACHDACVESYVGHQASEPVFDPSTGAFAVNADNDVHTDGGGCHGLSEWRNPNLLKDGGFNEMLVDPETGEALFGGAPAEGEQGWRADAGQVMVLSVDDRYPLIGITEDSNGGGNSQFVDLNGNDRATITQTFAVVRGVDYVVSMWVSADFTCQGNEKDPNTKSANVVWDDTTVAQLAVDVTGWDETNYEWKLFAWEVRSEGHTATLTLESTNGGCGGVLIDEVSVRMAHAGTIDNVANGECAVVGQDFDVEVVEQNELQQWGLRDQFTLEQLVCGNGPEFPRWYDCRVPNVGVITDAGGTRRYAPGDTAFTRTFGGYSTTMDRETAMNVVENDIPLMSCTSYQEVGDVMSPWANGNADVNYPAAVFAGPSAPVDGGRVTVFTYKMSFDHKATILNIKVVGSKFEGSVFALSSEAQMVLGVRRFVNLDSGHFTRECDVCGDCTVIVPGDPTSAEQAYYFEEQSDEAYGRIRASFCVRTPICLLHGEHAAADIDPHTREKAACGDDCDCEDGLFEHLDTYDDNFVTQIVEPQCERITTDDHHAQYGGALHMGDTYSVKFGVKKVAGDIGTIVVGLFDEKQAALYDPGATSCTKDASYYVTITATTAALHAGWPQAGGTLLASAANLEGLLHGDGEDGEKYFWIDAYYNKATEGWSVRVGRDMGGATSLNTVMVGTDVFLQYDVPIDSAVVPISHYAVHSMMPAEWYLCTHTATGMPESEKTCSSWDECLCSWVDPDTEIYECVSTGCDGTKIDGVARLQTWDNIPCSDQCGEGQKIRTTSCVIREYEAGTLCRAKGNLCGLFENPTNDNCRVQLFMHHPHGYGHSGTDLEYSDGDATRIFSSQEEGNLNDPEFMGGCAGVSEPCEMRPVLDNNLSTLIIEGAGCSVIMWDDVNGWDNYEDGGVADNSDGSEWLTYSVPDGMERLVVLWDKNTDDFAEAQREKDTFYQEFARDQWNDKASSIMVRKLNEEYCTEDTKPATIISCSEDRGCCYVAVYGKWYEGEQIDGTPNSMSHESVGQPDHHCMNWDNNCDCDDEVGLECREVRYEKRKYRCAEWVSSEGVAMWGSYYLNDAANQAMTMQALRDWGDGPETPICKSKVYVDTKDIFKEVGKTYTPLDRWQYSQGCPETNEGLPLSDIKKNTGAVSKGSMLMQTHQFYGVVDMVKLHECSGDDYWFAFPGGDGVWGMDAKTCGEEYITQAEAKPQGETKVWGLYPHECRNCGVEVSDHWCECGWETTDWTACEGCGDVEQFRKVECYRQDQEMGAPGSIPKACSQATLDTFGGCCHSPLYYSGCGGCTEGERPTTMKACIDTSKCNYEWHVKVGDEKCDVFSRCVSWQEWTIDDRHNADEASMKQWCTAGPERVGEDNAFVTYGLGACWLPDTLRHSKDFTTASSWAEGGVTGMCSCYYGETTEFGALTFDLTDSIPAKAGKRYASRFNMLQPGWVNTISVAAQGAGGTLKGSIYSDNVGGPGVRIATTEVASVDQERMGWVEMTLPQYVPQSDDNKGVYLSGGFYWLAVNVNGDGVRFSVLGQGDIGDGGAPGSYFDIHTESHLQVDEAFGEGNGVPAYDFGGNYVDGEGIFSIKAVYEADDTVHATKDLFVATCADAGNDCDRCMRANAGDDKCVFVLNADRPCMSEADASSNGYTVDPSCSATWGVGMFAELEHWTCAGEAQEQADSTSDNGETISLSGHTIEECAERCHDAASHWEQESYLRPDGVRVGVPSSIAPFNCEAFTYLESTQSCQLYAAVAEMEDVVATTGGFDLAPQSSLRCYVPNDVPNPCKFANGEWIRGQDAEYYYVGTDGFLYLVETGAGNALPTCDGATIFGNGRTFDSGPEKFCNGYFDDELTPNNPSDTTCARCLQHMLDHNMVAGTIDGSASSCGNFGTKTTRVCQGEMATMSCVRGAVQINSATYGRTDGAYCNAIPVDPDTGVNMFATATQSCGSSDNVLDQVRASCGGKGTCSLEADASEFGDMSCPSTYKYLQYSYQCV